MIGQAPFAQGGAPTNDGERYELMSASREDWDTDVQPGKQDDFRFMISAGPFNLAPGGSVRVAFAIAGAPQQGILDLYADDAIARWNAGIPHPCGVTPVEPTTWGRIKSSYK